MPELIHFSDYDIANDPDLNKFTTSDMEEIAKSGVGHSMQQSAAMVGFVVLIVIMIALLGMFAYAINKLRRGR